MDLNRNLVRDFDEDVKRRVNDSCSPLSVEKQELLWFGRGIIVVLPVLTWFISTWIMGTSAATGPVIDSIVTGAFLLGFIGSAVCVGMADSRFQHPAVKRFLKRRKKDIASIRKELGAFQKTAWKIGLVKDRSPHFPDLEAQCEQKQRELVEKSLNFIRELERCQREAVEADQIMAGEHARRTRLAIEKKDLQDLAKNLDAIIPVDPTKGLTQDVAGHVATLQAIDAVNAEASQVGMKPDPFLPEKT